ncbi:MAG: hypothetical protein DRI71_11640 [Bacteroidetes bacterium]|nr:MAG: hypothetical protein DRI71_11640 [Bacteroidota bacterium]
MTHKILVFALIVGLSFSASGQTFLVLEKMGTKKRYEFKQGEQIEVILDNDDFFTRLTIVNLGDSSIIAVNDTINFSSVKAVKLRGEKTFLKIAGPSLMLAGVLLFVLDATNQAVVSGGGYEPSSGVTTASVALVGAGALFTFAGRSKIKMKKWWRLRTVQI